jgi:hypothetical protein
VAEVVRKRSLSSGRACRGYGSEANVELIGDPSQQWRRCPWLLIDLATEKNGVSSKRARGTRECRYGGERELAVMASFTTVSDSGDLARSQQRERETAGGGALRSRRRGEVGGEEMAARKAREGVYRALYCLVGAV